MSGKLYIVPTPVGNLQDMTPRAIDVLRSASAILAEDTRTSAVLMRHFDIRTPMLSHHKFNEHESVGPLIERMNAGETLALVSDAGTPGISDPGFMLSRECRRNGIPVETLPGATAFVPALVNSGLPCDRFIFQGFLPIKKGRATRLQEIADSTGFNSYSYFSKSFKAHFGISPKDFRQKDRKVTENPDQSPRPTIPT